MRSYQYFDVASDEGHDAGSRRRKISRSDDDEVSHSIAVHEEKRSQAGSDAEGEGGIAIKGKREKM